MNLFLKKGGDKFRLHAQYSILTPIKPNETTTPKVHFGVDARAEVHLYHPGAQAFLSVYV